MSKTKRKRYSAKFKARAALEALKGEKTIAVADRPVQGSFESGVGLEGTGGMAV